MCYSVDTYDTLSSQSACPAFCKINNVKPKKFKTFFCNDSTVADLKVKPNTGNAVLIKSPKYKCNQPYPRGFMCIYSVKMPCSANSLDISHSDIDLSDNDYIQVIDNSRSQPYSPVTGDEWPSDQLRYPSSNLKVVFWSDRDTTQGNGFSLQFSCPAAIQEVPSQQIGSGDSSDILTT